MIIKRRTAPGDSRISLDLHPILKRIYHVRGAREDADYMLELAGLEPPECLLNIDRAVALLLDALGMQSRILVIGDFDADGATSTALLLLCLRAMGFRHTDYLVPNRFEYGYGLTPEIVHEARHRNPDLIITVDNGIASHEGVRRARELGIKVLVTDHHLPGDELPQADCIVNPNQPGCGFSSKSLAGVGVVFYLMLALRRLLRERGWFDEAKLPEPNMAAWLDIVALGTVADVVPLDTNNRRMVRHGLNVIKSGRGRPGILALLEVAGRRYSSITANDLGFAVGPRLNAAGRLDDMSLGIECLLTDDASLAWRLAQTLNDLNLDRKRIEGDMQTQAMSILNGLQMKGDAGRLGICLYEAGWHQGVIGIVASRVKDRFHRPTIVFADQDDSDEIKGSARSIPGLHMRDLLDIVATRNPGLLSKFGGHAMAAGLSLKKSDFPVFAEAFEQALAEKASREILEQCLYTDGSLEDDCLTLDFAAQLEAAGPWGQGFPEPLFTGRFTVLRQRVLAEKHLKLVLASPTSGRAVDAIAFNQDADYLAACLREVELVYRVQINEFRGERSVQLMIERITSVEIDENDAISGGNKGRGGERVSGGAETLHE